MAGGFRFRRVDPSGGPAAADLIVRPFQQFARLEAAGGILLVALTVIALIWANSAWGHVYEDIFHARKLTIGYGGWALSKSLEHWINDGLMALFFLLVGLEVKREIVGGELSDPKKIAVPIAAAAGGMLVPAALFALVNAGAPTIRGWGVPMATDIAFALGVLAMLGSRVPASLRVYLSTLAIIDDIGALLVIALFYTESLAWGYLGWAGGAVALMIVLNRLGFARPVWYLIIGVFLWYFILKSGVHATIAGVLVALCIPSRARVHKRDFLACARAALAEFEKGPVEGAGTTGDQKEAVHTLAEAAQEVEAPLLRLEHALVPYIAFLVVPVFALANAGVTLGGGDAGGGGRLALGIAIGLFVGKPLGCAAATWLAVRTGLGSLPRGVTWRHTIGAGFLAGIGFTMAMFIAQLAFRGEDSAHLLSVAKLSILGASACAGIVGAAVLATGPRRAETPA